MRYGFSLLFFIANISAAQAMPDFEADYTISRQSMIIGHLHQQLTTQNNIRTMILSSSPLGLAKILAPDHIQEKSTWREKGHHIKPLSYSYDRTGGRKEKHITTFFDWAHNEINISYKNRPYQLPLSSNTFDKLSYHQALINDLVADKTKLSYKVVDKYRLKTYTIVREGTETIKTPFGEFEAIKLVRQRIASANNKPERHTTLWCAPSLGYLPVKLEHIEKDGSKFIALLQNLTGIAAKP